MRSGAPLLVLFLSVVAFPSHVPAQESSDPVQRTSGIVEIDGVLHPYLLEGRGVPCVVVGPAFFFSQFFSDELKQHIQFVLIDFKKTWMAADSVDLSHMTIASTVEEIDKVREAFGYDKICVIGNSLLGHWPLEYARAFPEHISYAILIGTPPAYPDEYQGIVNEFFELNASEERKAKLNENWERIPAEVVGQLSWWDEYVREGVNNTPLKWYDFTYDPFYHFGGRQEYVRVAAHVIFGLLQGYDPRESFGEIEAPVFLALGRHDYMVPYTMWDGVKERIQKLTWGLFEKSGHYPMLEEQELFDQRLIEFLKRWGL